MVWWMWSDRVGQEYMNTMLRDEQCGWDVCEVMGEHTVNRMISLHR